MKRTFQVFLITTIMYLSALENALSYNISTQVYIGDSNTPLELADPCVPWVYRNIMVGTHLTIIVNSKRDGRWEFGELSIWGTNRNFGLLNCRGTECENSRLPAAGSYSIVESFEEDESNGFRFSTDQDAVAGDWFIIDYNATNAGVCPVAFFDGDVSWDDPLYEMLFTHIPSCDFNGDNIVNFADFSLFGSYWGVSGCADPDGCGKVDLDGNGTININDLGLFADFWLERTN
jgi:hypothetical protein